MAKRGTRTALLDEAGRTRVVEAIGAAEARSHGEVRVHVEDRCPGGDPVARGRLVFEKLGMTATRRRNGVLIYVAARDRCFAVLGDSGLHEKVGEAFWSELAASMGQRFGAGDFAEGLVETIGRAGDALAAHFPREGPSDPDVDELPNRISFGRDDPTAR